MMKPITNNLIESKERYVTSLCKGKLPKIGDYFAVDIALLLYHMEVPYYKAEEYLQRLNDKVGK